MGTPVVIVSKGGLPVTQSSFGTPVEVAENGYGLPVSVVLVGGLPVSALSPLVPAWVIPGASLDLDFVSDRGWNGSSETTSTSGLTASRASTGYAETASGLWVPFNNNVSRRTDRGLLVEEGRTNSIRNNSMQGASAGSPGTLPTNWISNLENALTRTVDVGTSLGIDYLDVTQVGTTATTGRSLYFEGTKQVAATVGQTWTLSGFFALPSGSLANITNIRLLLLEKDSAGTTGTIGVGSSFAGSLTSALQRLSLTYTTVDASTAFVQPAVQFSYANGAVLNITLRIGWPQLELGAFATSPIRTTNAAATRAADDVSMPTGSWFNANAGTLYGSVKTASVQGIQTLAVINNGADNDRYTIRSSSGSMAGTIITGGVLQAGMLKGTLAASALLKSAMAFEPNNAAFTTAGATPETDITISLPTVTTLRVGSRQNAEYMNGYIQRIAYFPRRLSNAELQSLTA